MNLKKQIENLQYWELELFKCLKEHNHTQDEQKEIKDYLKLIRNEINKLKKNQE